MGTTHKKQRARRGKRGSGIVFRQDGGNESILSKQSGAKPVRNVQEDFVCWRHDGQIAQKAGRGGWTRLKTDPEKS